MHGAHRGDGRHTCCAPKLILKRRIHTLKNGNPQDKTGTCAKTCGLQYNIGASAESLLEVCGEALCDLLLGLEQRAGCAEKQLLSLGEHLLHRVDRLVVGL